MPSAHTPEWSKIRTLKAKLQTGRCTASGGRVGRELTEEELEDCRERLAQLEQKRDQGIEDRRVAKETHDNTEKLLDGQQEILHAIHGVSSRLDNVIAPSGSSAHHKLLAKEAAKRERDLEKKRRHLQQGIVPTEGDFYVGTVLVKADALDQLEELRDRDLEAEFSLNGLPCRLVQISGQSGIVHLLAPDLAVLKSKRQDMSHYNLRLVHEYPEDAEDGQAGLRLPGPAPRRGRQRGLRRALEGAPGPGRPAGAAAGAAGALRSVRHAHRRRHGRGGPHRARPPGLLRPDAGSAGAVPGVSSLQDLPGNLPRHEPGEPVLSPRPRDLRLLASAAAAGLRAGQVRSRSIFGSNLFVVGWWASLLFLCAGVRPCSSYRRGSSSEGGSA